MEPVRILWSDDEVLAVLKPGAVPVQSDQTRDPDLHSLVREQQREAGLQLTHRLDRPVSGVVLFARTAGATAALNEQFRERTVHKVYWAIVEGLVGEAMVLHGSLQHDVPLRKARVVQAGVGEATGRLQVTPLKQGDRYTLVEVVPEGGAFHQIRAQLSTAGHPIKGDVKYGARRGEKDRSIFLHARSITFRRPLGGTSVTVVAPVPEGPLWHALAGAFTTDDQG